MKYINELKEKSGIYIISNDIDHRIYVGSAINFKHRYRTHKSNLLKGKNCNVKLLNFINKYGIEHLTFTAAESCSKECMIKLEQEYLDRLLPFNENGFNINKLAESPLGYKHTDAAKTKMKLREKRIVSQEEKQKLSNMRKGIPRDEKIRQKMIEKTMHLRKTVLAFNNKHELIKEFNGSSDCASYFNITKNAVKQNARNKSKTSSGVAFIYKEDMIKLTQEELQFELKRRFNNENLSQISVFNIDTKQTKTYNTISEFCKEINSKPSSVVSSIKRNTTLYKKYKIEYK